MLLLPLTTQYYLHLRWNITRSSGVKLAIQLQLHIAGFYSVKQTQALGSKTKHDAKVSQMITIVRSKWNVMIKIFSHPW